MLHCLIFRAACLFVISLFFMGSALGAGTLVVPPSPGDLSQVEHLKQSGDYTVEVKLAGDSSYQPCFVYKTDNYWTEPYFHGKPRPQTAASFTNFSFAGSMVDVRIICNFEVKSVVIRPLNFGVKFAQSGNTITFSVASPRKLSVEVNDRKNPLFLFADTPDTPNPKATYTYGPGVHHIGRKKVLHTNESVYIAGGAVVEGSFVLTEGSSNIRITGRGILTMGEWPHTSMSVGFCSDNSAIRSGGTANLIMEGIIIANSTAWTVAIDNRRNQSHDNQYRNLKLVCWNGNTDGIWFDGDRNIVDDCFIFNNDDVVTTHISHDCVISNLVAWGGMWGRLFMHTDWASSSNLTFRNINVIGKDGGPEMILIEGTTGRKQTLSNFTFKDIRIEAHPKVDKYHTNKFLRTDTDKWKINIRDWRFENITLDDKNPDEGDIYGTPDGTIQGITFINLKMAGTVVTSLKEANMDQNSFVSKVTFETASGSQGVPKMVRELPK